MIGSVYTDGLQREFVFGLVKAHSKIFYRPLRNSFLQNPDHSFVKGEQRDTFWRFGLHVVLDVRQPRLKCRLPELSQTVRALEVRMSTN